MTPTFEGLFAVLPTPFCDDGGLDEPGLDRLVEFYLTQGARGLVILSVMGESRLLLGWERLRVAKRTLVITRDRAPVIVGALGHGSREIAAFARQVADMGAAGVLVAPPAARATAADEDTVIALLSEVAAGCELAIAVLNYPPLGALPVRTLVRLADEVPAVRAVKHEVSPTPQTIADLRAAVGDRLAILGGLGGVHALPELERGSDGFMTGFSFPEVLAAIHDAFGDGDHARAEYLYARWLPLLVYEGQPGLGVAARKELLRQRGVIASAHVRTPTPRLREATRDQLGRVLERVLAGVQDDILRAAG